MKIKVFFSMLCALGVAAFFSGCAGYRLGSMLPKDIETVYVPTFINQTKEPLIEREATAAVISEIQKDGSLRVTNEEDADSILNVTLVDYMLTPVSYQDDKRTAAREYRLTLTASLILKRKSDDSIVAEFPRVQGDSVFELIGDLTSAKARGLPVATEDLAHDIVERVVEAWQ